MNTKETQNNEMKNNEIQNSATQNQKMPNKKIKNNKAKNNATQGNKTQNADMQGNQIPTDEILPKAAAEYATAMQRSLPKPEDCGHVFSEGFEEKIKELRKRRKRGGNILRYPAFKLAAGIALFLLVSAASLFTVSESARAELLGWLFRQQPVDPPEPEKPAEYPLFEPVPEFTPTEEQIGLLLLIEQGDARGDALDKELVDTLNNYLQAKGYSFYLDVRWLNRDASYFEENASEEERKRHGGSTLWNELAAGVKPDFISVVESSAVKEGKEWKPNFEREVTEGLLLPFSEYPDTPAARELMAVYPEEYKKFSSFQGECYGWSLSSRLVQYGIYLNTAWFERIGVPVPEELDFTNLDELLKTAEENGIRRPLGIGSIDTLAGLERLSCGLYLKHKADGSVVFVNPLGDAETLRLLEAAYRYKENGWLENPSGVLNHYLIYKGGISLDSLEGSTDRSEGFSGRELRDGITLLKELPVYQNEASLCDFLAITRMSEHKEEAVELLNLLFTDEEVIRIMRYGYEGFHYVMGNNGPQSFVGKGMRKIWRNVGGEEQVSYKEIIWGSRFPLDASYGNTKTSLPEEMEWDRKSRADRLAAQIENVVVSPYVGEFTSVQEKMLKRIAQRNLCQRILTLNSKNYQEDLLRARKDLADMGYDRLVRQMNARYGFTDE